MICLKRSSGLSFGMISEPNFNQKEELKAVINGLDSHKEYITLLQRQY